MLRGSIWTPESSLIYLVLVEDIFLYLKSVFLCIFCMFLAIIRETENLKLIRQLCLTMPEASTLRNHINLIN